MARLTAEMTLEQVEDFFTIGKTPKVETVARSKSGGRALDPVTGKPAVYQQKTFVPPYKRHVRTNNPQQKAYAEAYREQEDRLAEDMSYMHLGSSRASTVSGMMEQLEADSTITGLSTIILPEGQTEEQANQVYRNYNFKHEYDPQLSITKYRQEILDNIESNQVVVIQGPTGSGKTTQVPQYILDHYASMNKYCNIVVTQPRKIAAMSICNRVCQERQWEMSRICGYQVSMDRNLSDDTRLLYCTTGVLLEKLISAGHMQQFTHVILDEVHERDQDTDFCLLIVRKFLRSNSRDVKIILMSATAEAEKFARYFGVPIRGHCEPAPMIPIEGRTYKIYEYFLEDFKKLGEMPMLDPEKPGVAPEATDLAVKLILQFDRIEAQSQTSYTTPDTERKGAVLIFLPGLAEIMYLETKLSALPENVRTKLWIIPLHSTITSQEQSAVFQKTPLGMRKIILSTNIAESSITVPDVKYVIDFCLTKNLVADPETSYTSLQVQWASKSNCIQRSGRAGRVSDGRVYKMVTRQFYKEHNPRHAIPEMERAPLEVLVLKSKRLHLGEPKAILGLALDPPHLDNIEVTILLLKEIGALAMNPRDVYDPHDGDLTFMGRVLAQLPVDIRLGKLMMLGHVFGILEETIIIAASLSMKSFFARPYKSNLIAYKHKLQWADNSFSDCIAYLLAFKTWRMKKKETRQFYNMKQEHQWGKDYYIQIKRINEVDEMVDELKARLRHFNIVTPNIPRGRDRSTLSEEEHQLLLKLVLCGAFYPNYFVQGHMDERETYRAMSGKNPFTTVMVKGLPQNQGTLYKKDLETLFSKCCTVSGAKPNISFEETKAYIEFNRTPTDETPVLRSVYVAIKMRQLQLPLTIRLHERDLANQKMRQLSEIQDEKAKAMARLRTNRIKAFNDVGLSMAEGPCQVELPSPIQTVVPVYVTEIVTCGHFWVHYGDPDTWSGICQVQTEINRNRGQLLKVLPPDQHRAGVICIAPFTEGDSDYYRARIEVVNRDNNVVTAMVFFVDYGNSQKCLISDLREIDKDLLKLPFQAIECNLYGIQPSPIKCPNGRWTQKAKDRFAALVSGKASLLAKVYSIVHGVLRIELIEKKPSGERDDNINERLINEYIADKCEESYLSKQNHEERETAAMMLPSNSGDTKQGFDQHEGAGDSSWPRAISKPLVTPTTEWMTLPNQDEICDLRTGPGRVTNLQGPDSPYEMKFYSMTAVGSLREARIDRESVNSVAINDQIQVPHARMMVAAHVGLNPSGTTVMARDTTLMPLMPGLPGLVCLLFCPKAEMRCDIDKKRYTGALCGLGFNEYTGGPVMPDHDLEITFDTEFTEEDLKKINGVRMGIHISIGAENMTVDWDHNAIYKIQKSTQQKILSLFQGRRKAMDCYYFPRQHQWNAVDPDYLLFPQIEDMVTTGLILHCGIALNTGSDEEQDDEGEDEEENEQIMEYLNYWRGKERHMNHLHKLAGRSTVRQHTHCELCDMTLITPRELMMHLALQSHSKKEYEVRQRLGLVN